MRARMRLPSSSSDVSGSSPAGQPFGEGGHRRADVADHLGIGMEHLLDRRGCVPDMDDLRATLVAHQEWRLLDRVMADRDDQVRQVDRIVHVVALGKRCRADIERSSRR